MGLEKGQGVDDPVHWSSIEHLLVVQCYIAMLNSGNNE